MKFSLIRNLTPLKPSGPTHPPSPFNTAEVLAIKAKYGQGGGAQSVPVAAKYTQADLKAALKYRVDNGLEAGLGYDFFTTIGKSLKTGAIKMVAPSVSKLTGVSVDKVKAQLQKTHINGGKIAGNLLKKKDKKGNTVIPVVDVQDPAPSDISDGTPATNEDKPYMAGKLPAYALPVAGGLLVLIAVGIYKSRS